MGSEWRSCCRFDSDWALFISRFGGVVHSTSDLGHRTQGHRRRVAREASGGRSLARELSGAVRGSELAESPSSYEDGIV